VIEAEERKARGSVHRLTQVIDQLYAKEKRTVYGSHHKLQDFVGPNSVIFNLGKA
jgi:hypothetical protein